MFEGARRVLVTGASGFVGQAMVRKLKQRGVEVSTPSRSQGVDFMVDPLDLAGIDHVFHLAARTSVPAAWNDPVDFHRVNAHGTMRVLDQCRRAECSITYLSGYVYGTPKKLPIAETDPVEANNPYAFSKLMGEECCHFYAETFGLRVNILRPFNIYGEGQDERFVFPVIVNQVMDPACREVAVKDLKPRRDYIHIDDVISAAFAMADQPRGATYNAGSGESVSVADVIDAVFRASGIRKPIKSAEETRANEIMDVVADTTPLRSLGWKPLVSLDSGIQRMVAATQKRLNLRQANGL